MRLAARALSLALVVSALGCDWMPPPFRIVPSGGGVILDVQTLGEYMTSISRIRISDERGAVIWDLRAKGRAPQIWTVKLHCGSNNSLIVGEYHEYEVVVPKSPTFVLRAKATYIAEVWSPHSWLPARRSFTLSYCS
jgi:hypothetical protein